MTTGTVAATLVVGNPRQHSRTLALAHRTTDALRVALTGECLPVAEPDLVDLAWLAPRLFGGAGEGRSADGAVGRATALACRPGLLVVVSPTFKGTYTGLLKTFFDLLPMDGLAGAVAVPVMTAGWPQHRFAVDAYLRTLLVELGATVPVRGLSVLEDEFATVESVLAPWVARTVPALAAVLRRLQPRPEQPRADQIQAEQTDRSGGSPHDRAVVAVGVPAPVRGTDP